MYRAKYLKFHFAAPALLVWLLFAACRDEDPPHLPVGPPVPEVTGYGTPFEDMPAIADMLLYEVNPRVFSPTKNLAGITARLDSLAALGINVVWLMPIHPTGSVRSVGSPYAVRDHHGIHPDYGSLSDLRALVDKAHACGMAVILDWVANHTAWDHAWMAEPDWYVRDAAGNVIHPPGTNWQDVAELNYDNSAMRQAMIQAMQYWVVEANVDGFRCDYAAGVPADFWRSAIDSLRSLPGRDLLLFAEAEDKALLDAGFDLLFGWPFYGRLKSVFQGQSAQQLHAVHLSEYSGLAADEHILRWITNHDQHAWEATPATIFGGRDAALAAFVLASHMGGVPLIYNGQEVDAPTQLPFFEGQQAGINWNLYPETKERYRKMLRFRQDSPALRRGILTDRSSADVVSFTRTAAGEEVLVLVNVRPASKTYTLPAFLKNTDWTDAYDGSVVSLGNTLSLDAFAYRVLRR
ncbi:MAG: hypothetical protein RLY31_1025 [Bacteroidota bacterium]